MDKRPTAFNNVDEISSISLKEAGLIVFLVGLLSVYTIGVLWLADIMLAKQFSAYRFSGNYTLGIVFFFIASVCFGLWARVNQRLSWQSFVFGSLAIYLPLVLLSSCLTIFIKPDNVLLNEQFVLYCNQNDAIICGEAFAAVVLAMSLRALPAVLTVPGLFWYLLFRHGKATVGQ